MSDTFDFVTEPSVDSAAEFAAAMHGTAVCPLAPRGRIQLTGADRAKFLHNFCTNDIRGLQPGKSCEAFVTSVQGKSLAHVFVHNVGDALHVDVAAANCSPLLKHLQKYHVSEDLEFAAGADDQQVYVTGPTAAETLDGLMRGAGELPILSHSRFELNSTPVRVHRVDWFERPGYLITGLATGRDSLAALFGPTGGVVGGASAFEAARILAGFPTYGVDITADNLAQEIARTPKAISFTKGCYLGQEPIARIDALGHTNRELRVLHVTDPVAPTHGDAVVMADDASRGIGTVTSAASLPGTDTCVALAYMKRSYDTPGLAVRVQLAAGVAAADVVPAGFVAARVIEPNSVTP